jgi:NADH-quinone oxidoreductase subunit M
MTGEVNTVLSGVLVALLVVPAAAAGGVFLLGPQRGSAIRWLSLAAVLLNLLLAGALTAGFLAQERERPAAAAALTFQPEFVPGADPAAPHATRWTLVPLGNEEEATANRPAAGSTPPVGIQFYLGVDGLNLWLVALTAVLMVSCVLVSWRAVQERLPEYYAWLLLLYAALVGVFLAFDIILFYVFFELTLVPLFFLIGIWGGPERRYAVRKFFIYTLAGSVLTLLGVLAVVLACYHYHPRHTLTFAVPELVVRLHELLRQAGPAEPAFWYRFQVWVFLALAAGFAVKVPLLPLHTWLPLAHVEAPTAGSVLLAGVLLKVGAYGFLRLCLPLAPDACLHLGAPLVGGLAVAGILYGALCAGAQEDMKKLIAYSSVSHLGFCMLGMFALNLAGLTGSLLQMVNHGLSTGALFLLVGMLYERYHTRYLAEYRGLGSKLKLLAVFFLIITLSSIGLPGLNGFVSESLCLFGAFARDRWLAAFGAGGIILGAWYLLTLVQRVFQGPLQEPAVEGGPPPADLSGRECLTLAPILLLCLVLGLYPQPVIRAAQPDLEVVAQLVQQRQAWQGMQAGNLAGPLRAVSPP